MCAFKECNSNYKFLLYVCRYTFKKPRNYFPDIKIILQLA